jgi:hypothetical protein
MFTPIGSLGSDGSSSAPSSPTNRNKRGAPETLRATKRRRGGSQASGRQYIQRWPNQINPAAEEFVPRTPTPFTDDGASDSESQEEWDFAPPLPDDHVFERKDTERYEKKMQRWMGFEDDEFCYISADANPPRTNSVETKKPKHAKLPTSVSYQHFPYHSVAPTTTRMTEAQYREALKN